MSRTGAWSKRGSDAELESKRTRQAGKKGTEENDG